MGASLRCKRSASRTRNGSCFLGTLPWGYLFGERQRHFALFTISSYTSSNSFCRVPSAVIGTLDTGDKQSRDLARVLELARFRTEFGEGRMRC